MQGASKHKTTHATVRMGSAEQLGHAVRTAIMFSSAGYPMTLLRDDSYNNLMLGYTGQPTGHSPDRGARQEHPGDRLRDDQGEHEARG